MINRQWSTVVVSLCSTIFIHEILSTVVIPSDHLLPPPLPQLARPQALTHAKQTVPHTQNPDQGTSEPPGFMQRIARWFGFGPEDSAQQQMLQPASSYQYNQYKEVPLTSNQHVYSHPNQQYQDGKVSCGLCNKYPWVPMFPPNIQIPIANFYKKQQPQPQQQQQQQTKKWNKLETQASHYHHLQSHSHSSSQQPPLIQRAIQFNNPRQSLKSRDSRDRYHGPPRPVSKITRGQSQIFSSQSQQTNFLPTPSTSTVSPFNKGHFFKPIAPATALQAEESSFVQNIGNVPDSAAPTHIPKTKTKTDFEIIKSHQLTDFVASVEYPATYMQSHMIDLSQGTTQAQNPGQAPTLNTQFTQRETTTLSPIYASQFTDPTTDQHANTIDYQREQFNYERNQNPVLLTELGNYNYQNTPTSGIFSTPPSVYSESVGSTLSDFNQYSGQLLQQSPNEASYTDSDNYPSASAHNLTSVQEDNRLDSFDSLQHSFSLDSQPQINGGGQILYLPTPVPTTTDSTEYATEYNQISPSSGTTLTQQQKQQQYISAVTAQSELEENQRILKQQKELEEQTQLELEKQLKRHEIQKQQEEESRLELQRQQEELRRQQSERQRQEQDEWKRREHQKLRQRQEVEHRQQEQQRLLLDQQNLEDILGQKENVRLPVKSDSQINKNNERETPKRLLDSPIQYAYKFLNGTGNSSPRPFTRDPGELSLRPISGYPPIPGQLDLPQYHSEASSTPIVRSNSTPARRTPEDASPTSVYSSTDASGQFAGMSPPKQTLRQIIIPYTIKNKPRPFQLRVVRPKVEHETRYDTWSHETDFDGHEQQESKLISRATEPPPSKRTTKYFTKILASNIRELLKREHEKKNASTFDFVRLQKNIDDWTEQEFTSLSHKASTVSIRGRSKHIPTEYLTTTTPSARQSKTTLKIENLPTSINNLQVPLPDRGSKRYEYVPIVDNHLPENYEIKSTSTITPTTSTPSYIRIISSTLKPREFWHQASVAISPQTKEKVYVVTPQPRYSPHRTDTTTNTSTTEAVGGFKSPRFLVRPAPSSGFFNTTSTSTTPSTNSLYTPELFGLMGLSAYIPAAPVETITGHSKVITIVTPSMGNNKTVVDTSSRNHRMDDDIAPNKNESKGLS